MTDIDADDGIIASIRRTRGWDGTLHTQIESWLRKEAALTSHCEGDSIAIRG